MKSSILWVYRIYCCLGHNRNSVHNFAFNMFFSERLFINMFLHIIFFFVFASEYRKRNDFLAKIESKYLDKQTKMNLDLWLHSLFCLKFHINSTHRSCIVVRSVRVPLKNDEFIRVRLFTVYYYMIVLRIQAYRDLT